jgi:glycosyltransferase involved in cell wall biosynthesis
LVGKDQEQGGRYEAYLKRLAREYGLSDRVVFAGYRDEVADLLAASDMTVLPSNAEAFGLAIVESMAAKKPVVATATAGAREIVEDGITGLIVPIDDAAALGQAILRLVQDPRLGATLAENAYAHVAAHFDTETFFQKVMGVLSGSVPQRRRHVLEL